MGYYINPGNENFKEDLKSKIFIDKSLIFEKFGRLMNTQQKFICVSRPRRFGKTRIEKMMVAYFSKGCDSKKLFSKLAIAKKAVFDKNLNKFNVLAIDFGAIFSESENSDNVMEYLKSELLEDFRNEFPDIEFSEKDPVAKMIKQIYNKTKTQFIIIIDEYDVLVREQVNETVFSQYLTFLNSLFKNTTLNPAIALAYLTGILPIVRDKVQSKLNVFKESTMLNPFGLEEYFGFTKKEVEALCNKYKMSFAECEEWYDGYKIGKISVYNPNSVVEAMMRRECDNYWQITGSYEVISDYIKLDFDGVKNAVTSMLSGEEISVDVKKFTNSLDKINTKDDVFTYLIHLGYLNYDKTKKLCRIPNKEIREEWESAVGDSKNFSKIAEMIKKSEKLLKWTQLGDAERVAAALDEAHITVADPLDYNDESSLKTAILLAYYTAKSKYTIIKEMPTGLGFADIGFIPIDKKDPAIIVELKCNHDADAAIKQIKEKRYPTGFENYLDNLLLVGVNYDKTTKVHECVIEKYCRDVSKNVSKNNSDFHK